MLEQILQHPTELLLGVLLGSSATSALQLYRITRLLRRQLNAVTLKYWVLESAAQSVINAETEKRPSWNVWREVCILRRVIEQQQEKL